MAGPLRPEPAGGQRAADMLAIPGQRHLVGLVGAAARAAAVALPVLTVVVAFTGWFDTITRRAGHLAVAIPLLFLLYPAQKGRTERLGVLDIAFALVAALAFGWVIAERERIMWRLVYVDPVPPADMVLGLLAIAAVLEAVRRTLGWTLVLMAVLFLAYALAGPWMPGLFEHKGVPLELLVEHLYLVPEGLFNMVTGVMATYLMVFLTFGTVLRVAGGEKLFMALIEPVSRSWVGGPAKAAVLGSMFMGMVSGSSVANVVTTGTITIPLMRRHGFRPHEAAAVETAAGTGGALMPPIMGAGVFVMSEITGISLVTILAYSLLPALLYFGSVYAYVHTKARKRGLVPPVKEPGHAVIWRALLRGGHLLAPLVLLVVLLVQDYSPFFASAASVVALWGVSMLRRETRVGVRSLIQALEGATRGVVALSAIMACAALVVGVINLTGLMLKITSAMVSLADGSLLLALGLVALVSLVLGMGLPVTSAYIIIATVAAPALTEVGLQPLTAHLVIFWFAQVATITPPICLTAFVAAQIAGANPMRTGFEALRVGKALYLIPLMLAYSGLLSGHLAAMLWDAAAGLLFLATVPAAVEGFYKGPLSTGARIAMAVAGLLFLATAFVNDLAQSVACFAAGLAVLAALYVRQAQHRAVEAPTTG